MSNENTFRLVLIVIYLLRCQSSPGFPNPPSSCKEASIPGCRRYCCNRSAKGLAVRCVNRNKKCSDFGNSPRWVVSFYPVTSPIISISRSIALRNILLFMSLHTTLPICNHYFFNSTIIIMGLSLIFIS